MSPFKKRMVSGFAWLGGRGGYVSLALFLAVGCGSAIAAEYAPDSIPSETSATAKIQGEIGTVDDASAETANLIAPGADLTGEAVRDGAESALPQVLTDADAALYAEIFHLQEEGKWPAADKLIAKLSNRLLMGHVLFQRYMHPTAYRSRYAELRSWLEEYRDHPGADRVYALAMQRKPRDQSAPPRPLEEPLARDERPGTEISEPPTEFQRLSPARRQYIRTTQRSIQLRLVRGEVTRALELLNTDRSRRNFDSVSMDESLADIARGYFHAGLDQRALDTAGPAAERSGKVVPLAHWWAGLAAWRLGKYDVAARHFEGMADANLRSDWSSAAAAYWAARANLLDRKPAKVNRYLTIAAQYPRTFYGLLATRSLGLEPAFDWTLPMAGADEWEALIEIPRAKRALALVQLGEGERADAEIRRFGKGLAPPLARALLAAAASNDSPSLALRMARLLRDRDGEIHDAGLYPMPAWEPKDGFTIDRALVYGVMRQESRFLTRATSHAGARGLMQLMPRTAGYMAGRRFSGRHRLQLFDPELNITLGQKYVEHLLEDPSIDGDLFYTLAAYNGGPGNLRRWRRRVDQREDPLLFIVNIPVRETRIYVERVLTNFWIYRYRFGQPAPSLDAIAAGEWPSYIPLDGKPNSYVSVEATGL